MGDQNNNPNSNPNTGQNGNQSSQSGEIKGNQPMGQAERKPEHAGSDQADTDQKRKEKSAIGGGDKSHSGNAPTGQSSDKFSGETKTEEKSSESTGSAS